MPLKESNSIQQQLEEYRKLKRQLPTLVGGTAVNFFKRSFRRQGFVDERYKKWRQRSARDRQKSRRAILVKTGRLKRSIRITQKTATSVSVGSNVSYAEIHNEGGKITETVTVRSHKRRKRKGGFSTVKKHKRTMNTTIPQRQFAGNSKFLNKRIQRTVTRKLEKIFL